MRIKFNHEDLARLYEEAQAWQPPSMTPAMPVNPEQTLSKVLQAANGGTMMPKEPMNPNEDMNALYQR